MKSIISSLKILFTLLVINLSACAQDSIDYHRARQDMVNSQIISRGITDTRVIRAMKKVERHLFVPRQFMKLAYGDHAMAIGEGQTISQPYIVALMTDMLDLKPDMKVLEIGTGSGYQAAILAEIVDHVYSIEIVEALGLRSKKLLSELGYSNITLRIGDGYKGWQEFAPFDAIIVTCSPSDIPEPLKEQLKEGGKLIIPVGDRGVQQLVLIRKNKGKLSTKIVSSVRFVPMLGPDGKRY